MQLAPGTQLGAYEIVGLIGAGEMGEYRARDAKLNRDHRRTDDPVPMPPGCPNKI